MTTLTPPPVIPAAPPQPAGPPTGPRDSSRAVALVATILGGALVIGTIIGAVMGVIRLASVHTGELTASAAGVASLDVDVSSVELDIVYDDVSDATLSVTGSGIDGWKLERTGDALSLRTDRGWWGFRGWFDLDSLDRATLTLPESLSGSGMDATLRLSAGSITTDGDFGALGINLSAGSITASGSANTLTVDASAGRVVLDVADVREAELELSAGSIEGSLTGTTPESVDIDVSAGSLSLRLPEGPYAVSQDVSAGTFTNDLRVDPSSEHEISVDLSAGSVRLR